MVEVEDQHPNEMTPGLGPLGDHNLASGGANALGKAHMSIGVEAGTSTQDAGPSIELHTYIRHQEQKIDDLTTVVERDNHVRDELAEIKHLLQISPSHSSESCGRRRSHHSPPRSRGGGHLVEHRPRPSAKDRLEPPEDSNRAQKGVWRRERSRSLNPTLNGPRGKPSAFQRLGAGSVFVSSTYSVRIGKG
ncbi:hypothetical protein RHMOL_Rhmol02G0202000 [Rhododendron molle]|uniref:Uncharacterized protein n=1 Tax=Rhododendron molle TaxID=49168 RepID=A0ACC0PUX6_RHOML|nr:hypothetical protein RHMOL_Rhmol02G0202000 [Rhododendron molle]